jgi:hypothetical protein
MVTALRIPADGNPAGRRLRDVAVVPSLQLPPHNEAIRHHAVASLQSPSPVRAPSPLVDPVCASLLHGLQVRSKVVRKREEVNSLPEREPGGASRWKSNDPPATYATGGSAEACSALLSTCHPCRRQEASARASLLSASRRLSLRWSAAGLRPTRRSRAPYGRPWLDR